MLNSVQLFIIRLPLLMNHKKLGITFLSQEKESINNSLEKIVNKT